MKSCNKWVAKYQKATVIIFCVLLIPAYTFLLQKLRVPLWGIILVDLLLFLLANSFVTGCLNRVLKDAMEPLQKNGDPEPLLQITTELLQYKQPDPSRQILLIDQCVALREKGDHKKVFEVLSGINIDKCSGTLPVTKVTYYNNLMDICDLLGDYTQAEIWYAKLMQIYNDMPNNSFKKSLGNGVLSATAAHYYRIGDFEKVIPILEQIETEDLAHAVDTALLWAKTCLQQKDIETAKSKLQYILEHGNGLYAVTAAKNLIDEIPSTCD